MKPAEPSSAPAVLCLVLTLLLVAPPASGAVPSRPPSARPAAWRPLPALSRQDGSGPAPPIVQIRESSDYRAGLAEPPGISGQLSGQIRESSDHRAGLAEPSGISGQLSAQLSAQHQHRSPLHHSWQPATPGDYVNWQHPDMRGALPALSQVLATRPLRTLVDGSQETSDVIKAITQYHLVRGLVPSTAGEVTTGGEDRCACARADTSYGAPAPLYDTAKATATIALWAGLAAASSWLPFSAGRSLSRSARSLADTTCDVTARVLGVGSCSELGRTYQQLMTDVSDLSNNSSGQASSAATRMEALLDSNNGRRLSDDVTAVSATQSGMARRHPRSLRLWKTIQRQGSASVGSGFRQEMRRMGSRMSRMTAAVLRPLTTALRKWGFAAFRTSRSDHSASSYSGDMQTAPAYQTSGHPTSQAVAAARQDQPGYRRRRPNRRPSRADLAGSPAGCSCGWSRQGLGRRRGLGGLATIFLLNSYWLPVLGLVFLLGQNSYRIGSSDTTITTDDQDNLTNNVDITVTNSPSNTQESSQDNAGDAAP